MVVPYLVILLSGGHGGPPWRPLLYTGLPHGLHVAHAGMSPIPRTKVVAGFFGFVVCSLCFGDFANGIRAPHTS